MSARDEDATEDAVEAAERAEDAQEGAEQARDEAEAARDEAQQLEETTAELIERVESGDPLLDTAVRRIAAGADDEKPYGVPGPPTRTFSPFRIGLLGGLGLLTAYGVVLTLAAVRSVLVLLLISGFLAVGLEPAVLALEKRGMGRSRSVGVVLVVVLLGFAGFLVAIVPPIIDQTSHLITNAPDYLAQLRQNRAVADLDKRFHLLKQAETALASPSLAANTFGGVLGVGRVVFGAVFSTITVLTLTLYFMSSLPRMKQAAYRALPRSRRARVGLLTDDILGRVGGYVAGALGIAACAAITSFILLVSLGMPSPIALALVVAVTDLVPVIGATIGAVIVTSVAFAQDVRTGVIVAVFYLVYQQVENYVLYPRIMKRSVDVSPAVTIVAVLVGASLLGVVGALLAIPIAAAIQLILIEVVVPRQDAL